MNPAFALAEVVWMVLGRNDSAFLTFFNTKLPQFAGVGPTFTGAYGHRLRHAYGMDQLTQAASALRHNKESRQIVLRIWDTVMDMPSADGAPAHEDIPCNIVSLLKVRDGALHWTQIIRSNDLVLGLPHNLVQFTTLQELLAGWIGVDVGSYTQWSDSLHVYERDIRYIQRVSPSAPPPNSDVLNLSTDESEEAFRLLGHTIDALVKPTATERVMLNHTRRVELPKVFANWRAVLLGEIARRKGWQDGAAEVMGVCDNPVLLSLWQSWCLRVARTAIAVGDTL